MFEALQPLPPDPILGLTQAFRDDPHPHKVDLGVGVYKDESGNTPVMAAVRAAEARVYAREDSKAYLPPAGDAATNTLVEVLLFGADHPARAAGRVRLVQSPGGCGGLRLAGELVRRCRDGATVWVTTPTWANHIPLFRSAGLQLREYPYYDPATHGVRVEAMLGALQQVPAGDVVVLHGCCHNPTGADLEDEHWQAVAQLAARNGFLPLVDLAYQGFGRGLAKDAYGLRLLAATVPEMLVVFSASKNFGLYRERCGALAMVAADSTAADTVLSQALSLARGNYSMPPAHGAAIVGTILGDAALKQQWLDELDAMRASMQGLRVLLADKLAPACGARFEHIRRQRGMFSFLGVSPEQVARLRKEFGIYMVDSSRINIAGISPANVDYLARAITAVL